MTDFLRLQEVTFHYPKGSNVIRDCSLFIQASDTLWLSGNNGSGKTTLGKLLIGLLSPQRGKITLNGERVDSLPLDVVGTSIGYLFQNPMKQLFCTSVWEEVAFGLRLRELSSDEIVHKTEITLDAFDLLHRRDHFPHLLSRGEQQRLALASMVALSPSFLILDEPTTGLDERRMLKLEHQLDLLRERGMGFLIISHDSTFARRNARRHLELREGRVVDHG